MEDLKTNPKYGRWWYSAHPETTFQGVLQIGKRDLPELVIHGKQSDLPLFDLPWGPSTLFGRLTTETTLREVSVLNAHRLRGPNSTNPPDPERETEVAFWTNHILIGAHVESETTPVADRMLFRLTGFDEWCDATGFSGNHSISAWSPELPKDQPRLETVDLSFRSSVTPYFDIGGGRQLRFRSEYRGPQHFRNEKEITLREKNGIEIAFPERVSVETAVAEARLWQTFIALGLRLPVFIDRIVLARDDGGDLFHTMPLVVPDHRRRELPAKERYRQDILFNQSKLGGRIGERLKAWREIQERIDMSVLLFRSTLYLQDVYIHTHVPTYLQALEVFHHELYDDDKFPNTDAKRSVVRALRQAIPQDLDADVRKEICNRLSYIGSATYLERLQLLFQRYPKALGPLFPRGEEDLKKLRNARNFLTHYGEQREIDKEFMSSRDVYVVGENARLFLEVCLLGAMGMTDDEILALIKGFGPYRERVAEIKWETARSDRASTPASESKE